MKAQILIGSMLATTLALASLAGCQVKSPVGQAPMPGSVSNGTPGATGGNNQSGGNFSGGGQTGGNTSTGQQSNLSGSQASNPTTSSDASQAQSDEQDAQGYNAVGGQTDSGAAAYTLDALTTEGSASASASASASGTMSPEPPAPVVPPAKPGSKANARKAEFAKIKMLQARIRQLLKERAATERMKQVQHLNRSEFAAVQRAYKNVPWTDNGDGTETKTATVSLTRTENGKTFTRTLSLKRTVDKSDMTLVEATADVSETLPSGLFHSIHWDKALQADGSYDVVFQNDTKWPNKEQTERTAAWDKVIATNGNVSGTGVITWFKNGQQVSQTKITFGGTTDDTTASAPAATGTPPVEPSPEPTAVPTTAATGTATASGTASTGSTSASASGTASTGSGSASASASGTVKS